MSVTDFVKFYEGIGICKYHSDYRYKSISFDHNDTKKSYSIVRLIVTQKTHIFLSLNQKDDRCFDENKKYEYSLSRVMLGEITPDGLKYISGDFYNDRNLVLEVPSLNPGSYIVAIEIIWNQDFDRNFNLSM